MLLSPHDSTTRALHDAILAEIPGLRRFARFLLRAPDIADDLVQDTLTRAVAAAASFQPGTNVRAWLFTILKNATRNHARRQRRNPVDVVDTLDLTVASMTIASPLERLEFIELVAAIDRLPEEFRQVVLLCGIEGFPYEEAAQILDVPTGTIRSRLSRARSLLRNATDGKTFTAAIRPETTLRPWQMPAGVSPQLALR